MKQEILQEIVVFRYTSKLNAEEKFYFVAKYQESEIEMFTISFDEKDDMFIERVNQIYPVDGHTVWMERCNRIFENKVFIERIV